MAQENGNFVLTKSQQRAYDRIIEFLKIESMKVFILKGYAGTGKTTMMKILIEELKKQGIKYSLLASTGRAAKILSNRTKSHTSTVHGEIYKFQDLNQDLDSLTKDLEQNKVDKSGQLLLNFMLTPIQTNETKVYIVDEASMISDVVDKNASQAIFGSGRLLNDLLNYDRNGKFIFVGDFCQLPPVRQSVSPALSSDYFNTKFHIGSVDAELTDIVRQSSDNDIVVSASQVRRMYFNPQPYKWAKFPFRGYKNIHVFGSQSELLRNYINDIKTNGYNAATLLTFSNKQCDLLTDIVRPAMGISDYDISVGDLLLVTQNNLPSGLMNGDLVTVNSIGRREQRAGLTFVSVEVKELFTGHVSSLFMVEDILYANQTNITQMQQKDLFIDFYYRMKNKGIKQKSHEFNDMMMKDEYLNALRTVFGYALTCHKAQGGEWSHVYLDIPRNFAAGEKPYVYQWIYTAMTRASQELYVVDDFWVM